MNKKLIKALLCASLFLVSCSLTPNVKLSGLANLEQKQEIQNFKRQIELNNMEL